MTMDAGKAAKPIPFKLVATLCAFGAAIVAFANGANAEGLLSSVAALFGFLHELGDSRHQRVISFVATLRDAFRHSDKLARALIVSIAIGGTALVADAFYQLRLVPDFIDPLVKRSSIPMVGVAIVLLLTSITSNRIRKLAATHGDRTTLGYEVCFYAAAFLLMFLTAAFWLGFPLENCIASAAEGANNLSLPACLTLDEQVNYAVRIVRLPAEVLKLMLALALISLVWFIGFFACIMSRYFQCTWVRANIQAESQTDL